MRTDGTNEICAGIGDLIEGFAVGALEQDEMLQVARHIGECPAEQEQLLRLEETVGLLGLTVAPIDPPHAIWDRLEATTVPTPIRGPVNIRSRVSVPRWLAMGMAAAAVLLLVSSLALGMALRDANNDEPMFDSTLAAYLTSGGSSIPLSSQETPGYLGWNGRGSLLMAPNMPPMVIVDKCVPSREGYRYVVWLQRGDQRTPMGDIVIHDDGRGMMTLEGVNSLADYDMLGISIRTGSDKLYDVITGPPHTAE